MQIQISTSATRDEFTTANVMAWVNQLPEKFSVTNLKSTTKTKTVTFKLGTTQVSVGVAPNKLEVREFGTLPSRLAFSYKDLQTILNSYLRKQKPTTPSAKPAKTDGNGALDEFLPVAKAAGFKSPKSLPGGKSVYLGVQKGIAWTIRALSSGFTLECEYQDTEEDTNSYPFKTARQLEALLEKHVTNAPDFEVLVSGVYFCKPGTCIASSSKRAYAEAQKNGGKMWKLAPYGRDVMYIFTEKPTRIGTFKEVSQMNFDTSVQVPGKGVVVIALDDD